ncbi:prenyltransferase/squalene oxidase repeat-containing protein [Desulfoferula mesophila]|uniref:prenyltransferase/squalene oxidase repeat-containing protein n=1 Tax=Desulfoferula mesophila TaxID=3058419 RepID=UPI0030D4D88E
MAIQIADGLRKKISSRAAASGGFAPLGGRPPRPDCTAWAILALASMGEPRNDLLPARRFLAACQAPDGSVPFSPEQPSAWWPTALAVLAWSGAPEFSQAQAKAVAFLLGHAGHHYKRKPDSPLGHDTDLQGWPWVANTHAWVEPTAMAVVALRATGHGDHPRVAEAVRLLVDRQLSHGGWNSGNTLAFGVELRPMPDATGMALASLPGLVPRVDLQNSLDYLSSGLRQSLTPLSFAWSLLGLSAWSVPAPDVTADVGRILSRQAKLGEYDTSEFSQLLMANQARRGMLDLAMTLQREGA